MAEDKVSKSGIWVDSKTGKVVESAPEEGYQLVPPGFEVTPDMQAQVDLARKASKPTPAAVVDLSVQEQAPKAVTSATVRPTTGTPRKA